MQRGGRRGPESSLAVELEWRIVDAIAFAKSPGGPGPTPPW